MWGYVASVDNLFWEPLVWNSRATAKRLITKGRPVTLVSPAAM